jgi:DNA-binding LacI/PurR family transcriptional regulator
LARVTLQTIADRVGVSRMTVSNAFSRPDQLSAGLRDRILAAAGELGYVGPDPSGRALARGTTGAVGIVLTDSLRYAFTDLVATQFLGAVAAGLAPTGFALTLLSATAATDQAVMPARDVAIDGALIYSCDPTSPAAEVLARRGLPLVSVDQTPVEGVPSVNVADRAGARAAAEHLLGLGHRRIGLMLLGLRGPFGLVDGSAPPTDAHVSTERLAGWLDALRPAGVEPVVVRVRDAGFAEVAAGARLLLDRPDRPTAVLCFSDAVALGVVDTARDLGLSVPEDLSVVGFDDSPAARQFRPALTTVRQDVEEKGRAAAAALIAAMRAVADGQPVPAGRLLIPTELVVRDSTRPAS